MRVLSVVLVVVVALVSAASSQKPPQPAREMARDAVPDSTVRVLTLPDFWGAYAIWGSSGADSGGRIWFGVTSNDARGRLGASVPIRSAHRTGARHRRRGERAHLARHQAAGRDADEDPLTHRPDAGRLRLLRIDGRVRRARRRIEVARLGWASVAHRAVGEVGASGESEGGADRGLRRRRLRLRARLFQPRRVPVRHPDRRGEREDDRIGGRACLAELLR